MGLTRIRAEQISDIDYKQAVRVITVSDVTLSGGAPATVDGVSLVTGDRVLVSANDPGSENGIYEVQTVGAGSTGTWIRASDGNTTGELQAGLIIMVTEGDTYKDTQWKLTTNNPIIIGTTPLVFEQNSAFAFGNIYANSTAVLATSVGDSVTFAAGNNISILGNNTSKTVTIGVTGISLNSISNGTSNVNVVSSGGNVTVGINGTSNVAVFATTGEYITGVISATGNITGGNLIGTKIAGTLETVAQPNITSVGTLTSVSISGNVQGGNLRTAGQLSATGNITGGNVLFGSGIISGTGNITGGNILGNGASLSGINSFSNIFVSGGNAIIADSISDTLTITAGSGISIVADSSTDTITIAASGSGESIFATGGSMGTVTETVTASEDLGLVTEAPPTESYDLGGIGVDGVVTDQSIALNTISGNKFATDIVISTTGNITGGNVLFGSGIVSGTGNVTAGNIIVTGNIYQNGNLYATQIQSMMYALAF